MLEFMQKQLVWAVAMPLCIAIVCMAVSWRPWQRDKRESVRGWWGGPIAIGLGYLVGHVAINGWPSMPPASADSYLFVFAVLGILIGLLESIRMPVWIRWGTRLLFSCTISWFMISSSFRAGNSAGIVVVWAAGQAAAIFLIWTLLERLAERRHGSAIPLALSLLIAVASVYFLKGSSGKLAQLAGVLSASLGGAALVAMTVPRVSVARGMLAVVVPLYCALILYSWQYEKPYGTPIILAAAPLAMWLAEWRESTTAVMGRVLLAVLPGIVALVLLLWFLLDAASGDSLY